MKRYQTFKVLAFFAFWLCSCGNTDPSGTSRNTFENTSGSLSTQALSQETTVQSGGFGCVATPNPATIQSGGSSVVTLVVSGASGTVDIPQANIFGSSNKNFSFTTVLNLSGGGASAVSVGKFVVNSGGKSASCTVRITVTR